MMKQSAINNQQSDKKKLKVLLLGVACFLSMLLLIHIATKNPSQAPSSPPAVNGAESIALTQDLFRVTGNKSISTKTLLLPDGALAGKDMLKITYDLHGLCLLDGPSSAISLLIPNGQSFSVPLARYGQNCLNGKQSIDIPFSHFPNLSHQETVTGIRFTFWYPTSFTVDLLGILSYNSGGAVLGLSSDTPKKPVRKSFPNITPIRPSPYAATSRD